MPPFPFVRESLESMQGKADVMVVSATPGEALVREWDEHGLRPLVSLIAGQEMGSKQEHLALAAAGRYEPEKILMVGDAPGDLEGGPGQRRALLPDQPRREDDSWQRFFEEALPRFFAGTFAGDYMNAQLDRFRALLPERPTWRLYAEMTPGRAIIERPVAMRIAASWYNPSPLNRPAQPIGFRR